MKNYETDDTFLARWIAGELTNEELEAFKKTKVYRQFDLINREVQLLYGPDIDTEAALEVVKHKLKSKPKKSKVIRLWAPVAAAAMVIISAGLFFTSSKSYTTAIGETQTITLADGSVVNLNSNSSISLKRFFWEEDRQVNLIGEAYFTVTSGDSFKVNTSKGTIAVLGTAFNIKDRNHIEVKCYEGKVSFTSAISNKDSFILTKGTQLLEKDGAFEQQIFEELVPTWKRGFSIFKDEPLYVVLEELSNYFAVEFKTNSVNLERLFTGSFDHNDLDVALKATLLPMGIEYQQTNSIIELSE